MLPYTIEILTTNGLGYNPSFSHEDTNVGLVRHLGEMEMQPIQTMLRLQREAYRNTQDGFDRAIALAERAVKVADTALAREK